MLLFALQYLLILIIIGSLPSITKKMEGSLFDTVCLWTYMINNHCSYWLLDKVKVVATEGEKKGERKSGWREFALVMDEVLAYSHGYLVYTTLSSQLSSLLLSYSETNTCG